MSSNLDSDVFKTTLLTPGVRAQRKNIPEVRLSPPKRDRSSSPTRRSGSPDRRLQIAQLERERSEKIWPTATKRTRIDHQDNSAEAKLNLMDEKWLAKLDALEKLYTQKIDQLEVKIEKLETRIEKLTEKEPAECN